MTSHHKISSFANTSMLTKWLGHFLFDQVWLISFLTKYYISRFNRNNYWTKPPSIMNLTRPGLLTSPKHIFFYILFISQFDIFIFSYSYFHIHTFLELLISSYQCSIFIINNFIIPATTGCEILVMLHNFYYY